MISVLLLAYNEEASLPGLVGDIERAMAGVLEPHRIVVVDDGSRDRTAAIARELAASHPVALVSHEVNRGVGRAFDTGLRFAVKDAGPEDLVFTMEGDKTNDPACLPEMIRLLRGGCDVVCASRYAPGGAYVGFPLKRHALSLGANVMARLLFRVPGVKDYTIFYRGYRAAALRRAIESCGDRFIQCRGFASNAEILVKIARAGRVRCEEVPMVYRYDLKRGASKMKIVANLVEYLRIFVNVFSV